MGKLKETKVSHFHFMQRYTYLKRVGVTKEVLREGSSIFQIEDNNTTLIQKLLTTVLHKEEIFSGFFYRFLRYVLLCASRDDNFLPV